TEEEVQEEQAEVTESEEEVQEEESEVEEVVETEEAAEEVSEDTDEADAEENSETPVEEEVTETQADEQTEEPAEEETQEAEQAEDSEEDVVQESTEAEEESDSEENAEEEQESPEKETESEDDSEAVAEEPETQEDADSEDKAEEEEEVVSEEEQETSEPEVNDSETDEVDTEEDTTYKYDSESLEQELENLSEEERAAFLEENADEIEADEEMLNELTEAVSEEHGIDLAANEVYAADASTLSTMSMSQAITDINDYIAAQDFDVADIKYDLIEGLPHYAFESNYGNNPENGKPGKPSGVVLHDVGNENSTIHGEINYMSENWENAFVHAFVDADNIIQVANTDYLAYGAGEHSNQTHLHVELVRHDNQHDFAKSINNYADYIANLLYKYKLPAQRVDDSGNGTLWSHVEVSHIMGGTASPDPYEYFASHGYAYEDVISLIGSRYDDLYNKVTDPSIYMPTFDRESESLGGEITNQNRGIYESITDAKTYNADSLLGQDLQVIASEVYNFEKYYLLADADGKEIGWMYAGDVVTSALDAEPEEDNDTPEPETPEPETPEPETPDNNDTSDEDNGDTSDDTSGQEQEDNDNDGGESEDTESDNDTEDEETDSGSESPSEDNNDDKGEQDSGSDEGTVSDDVPSEDENTGNQGSDNVDEDTDDNEQESDDDTGEQDSGNGSDETPERDESEDTDSEETPDNDDSDENGSSDDSAADAEDGQQSENDSDTSSIEETGSNEEPESDEGTDAPTEDNTESDDAEVREESTDSDDDAEDDASGGAPADDEDLDVYSSLEDAETGVRVVSASDELDGKSLVVTVLGSSDAIGADHDLYDIHVLDEDGSLYSLQNPVTVYLPANGYVSNVYYLGNIGETLEAVNFRTEDGYAVFETDSFSQYAVVYGEQNEDNTTVAPVSENKDRGAEETSDDRANEHPTVYTEDVDESEDEAAAVSDPDNGSADGEAAESEVLPDTGVPEQSTTIFATILAALGLGFLVKRRKPTNR
ncbi:MAG TPA: hypothetical protein H9994_05630, partial [Candidatus Salinicoccus merdavium]|nr:hypothetical protein [Candidatus Salinicoccus merdavium]